MILKYLRKIDIVLILFSIALVAVQTYLDLEIPGYMRNITDVLVSGGSVDDVLAEGWKMMACALGSLVTAIIVGYIAAYIASSLSRTVRKKEFDRVQQFSVEEINRFSISSLITRSTNDVTQVQMAFAMGMQVLIKAPMMAVWAMTKIADKNMEWTIATGCAVVALLMVIGVTMAFTIPRFKRIQWINDQVNDLTKENLTGLRVVHAYNAEKYQEDKFKGANKDLTDTHLAITRALAFMGPMMSTIMGMLSLAIYWLGALIVNSGDTPVERIDSFTDMIVFSSYAMQIVMAFLMLVIVFMIIPRAMVAARRIEEVIDTEPSITDGTVTETEGKEGEISFRNVAFRYPDASDYVLEGISFDVRKGETVAFIGSTGSGKSTVVNLIPRFFDVTEGSVEVDGVDVRDYTLEALHRKIGYVPQKATIFNGTVASNVNYGDSSGDRTEEDVKKAVAIAQGTDFVEKMVGQYEGSISENGRNLSGGQKQRISIARAVCRRPEIYIFDDSFSALDYKTDRVLRHALRTETTGVTTLIVAQRIGTIMDADKIIVLDEGKIVGMGKHDELLRTCPVYLDIARSQLSEEELVR